jgi:hypothetical protein
MGGYGPKIPITVSAEDGFSLLDSIRETVKQNIKMLLLTVPGERTMMPNFGVGLKTYLFEQNTEQLREEISSKINEQMKTYLPFVKIISVDYSDIDSMDTDLNKLRVAIKYRINNAKAADMLILEP